MNADNELNKTFVEAWAAKHEGKKPYYVVADNYLAAQTLFAGIKEAKSGDPTKVKAALKDLTFDSIAGEVTMRGADHQLIRPSYLGQVVKEEGALAFKVTKESDGKSIMPPVDAACKIS